MIRGSGSVKILQNNLAGSVKLNDFAMSLKWSNIGNLRVYLIQVYDEMRFDHFATFMVCSISFNVLR